jgi:hypothetical protein
MPSSLENDAFTFLLLVVVVPLGHTKGGVLVGEMEGNADFTTDGGETCGGILCTDKNSATSKYSVNGSSFTD